MFTGQRKLLMCGTFFLSLIFVMLLVVRSRNRNIDANNIDSPLIANDFRLPLDFSRSACSSIEEQFKSNTNCICGLSKRYESTVTYGCRHDRFFCHSPMCAIPTVSGIVGLDSTMAPLDVCLINLHVGLDRIGNVCVNLTRQPSNGSLLARCRASLDGYMCKCSVCGEGTGIQLDCSGRNAIAVSNTCDHVGVLLSYIKGQPNSVQDFFPSFQKSI